MFDEFKDETKFFLDYLFPPIKQITSLPDSDYISNSIVYRSGIIYGSPGCGKTETIRALVEKAVEMYGQENVNAVCSDGNLFSLLYCGLDNKLVNILFADDLTLKKVQDAEVSKWLRVRNFWYSLTKRPYGLIVAIIATHRFHSIPVTLRSNPHFIIFKERPIKGYDESFAKALIGNDKLEFLNFLEEERMKDRRFYRFSIFYTKTKVGILDLPMAKQNYLKEPVRPPDYYWRLFKF